MQPRSRLHHSCAVAPLLTCTLPKPSLPVPGPTSSPVRARYPHHRKPQHACSTHRLRRRRRYAWSAHRLHRRQLEKLPISAAAEPSTYRYVRPRGPHHMKALEGHHTKRRPAPVRPGHRTPFGELLPHLRRLQTDTARFPLRHSSAQAARFRHGNRLMVASS